MPAGGLLQIVSKSELSIRRLQTALKDPFSWSRRRAERRRCGLCSHVQEKRVLGEIFSKLECCYDNLMPSPQGRSSYKDERATGKKRETFRDYRLGRQHRRDTACRSECAIVESH